MQIINTTIDSSDIRHLIASVYGCGHDDVELHVDSFAEVTAVVKTTLKGATKAAKVIKKAAGE